MKKPRRRKGNIRTPDMRWEQDEHGNWERVDSNDRRLLHEMETINKKKKS